MTIYVIVIISAIDAPAALIVQQSPTLIVDNQVVCSDIVSHIKAACSFVNIHG